MIHLLINSEIKTDLKLLFNKLAPLSQIPTVRDEIKFPQNYIMSIHCSNEEICVLKWNNLQ